VLLDNYVQVQETDDIYRNIRHGAERKRSLNCIKFKKVRQTQGSVMLVSMICDLLILCQEWIERKIVKIVKDDEKGRPCRLFQYSFIFSKLSPLCMLLIIWK
jgi:hypothetical protein